MHIASLIICCALFISPMIVAMDDPIIKKNQQIPHDELKSKTKKSSSWEMLSRHKKLSPLKISSSDSKDSLQTPPSSKNSSNSGSYENSPRTPPISPKDSPRNSSHKSSPRGYLSRREQSVDDEKILIKRLTS